jgi:hypothetical protein
MPAIDRGIKRVCQSCSTRFYDLGRTPISCPKCETIFNPEALFRSRRNRQAAVESELPTKPKVAAVDDDLDLDLDLDDVGDGDNAVIEDTSELGEDEEDMVDVIDNIDEDEDD